MRWTGHQTNLPDSGAWKFISRLCTHRIASFLLAMLQRLLDIAGSSRCPFEHDIRAHLVVNSILLSTSYFFLYYSKTWCAYALLIESCSVCTPLARCSVCASLKCKTLAVRSVPCIGTRRRDSPVVRLALVVMKL